MAEDFKHTCDSSVILQIASVTRVLWISRWSQTQCRLTVNGRPCLLLSRLRTFVLDCGSDFCSCLQGCNCVCLLGLCSLMSFGTFGIHGPQNAFKIVRGSVLMETLRSWMKLCQLHTLAEMAGQKCNKPDAQREVKKNQWKRWQKTRSTVFWYF